MKTKYILHGGYAGKPHKNNDKFFKEILKGRQKNLKILLVYFAKEKKDYKRKEEEDVFQFEKNNSNKKLFFEIAKRKNFVKQISRSNVIYLHGGKTMELLLALRDVNNLKELFAGKVIVGESAGVYVLSSFFYSKSLKGVFNGLAFVPVKTICHYVGKNSEKFKECPKGLKTLLLPDFQYKVFYIDTKK